MAQITIDNKKELKSLITQLKRINLDYAMSYHRMLSSLLVQYILLFFWFAHILAYFVMPIPVSYVWLFIIGSVGLFLGTFIVSLRFRKYIYSPVKQLYKRGSAILENLMCYVDWTVFRKQQLYRETDSRVEQVISRFLSLSKKRLSPTTDVPQALVISNIAIFLEFLFLGASIWCFEKKYIQELFEDIIIDTPKGVLLILLAISIILITALFILFIRIRVHVIDACEDKLSEMSVRLTAFCRLSQIYSNSMLISDRDNIPIICSLLDRFSSLLDSVDSSDFVNLNSFGVDGVGAVFEDMNRLRYRIEENIDTIELFVEIDEDSLKSRKSDIDSCLVTIYGHKMWDDDYWMVLVRAASHVYSMEWERNKDLPYQLARYQKISKHVIVLGVVFLLLVIYFFCSKLFRTDDVPMWMNSIVLVFVYMALYSMYKTYNRLKKWCSLLCR